MSRLRGWGITTLDLSAPQPHQTECKSMDSCSMDKVMRHERGWHSGTVYTRSIVSMPSTVSVAEMCHGLEKPQLKCEQEHISTWENTHWMSAITINYHSFLTCQWALSTLKWDNLLAFYYYSFSFWIVLTLLRIFLQNLCCSESIFTTILWLLHSIAR
jgi:hypothetical protein